MTARRHKGDRESYRTLANYKERMQSFNACALKLREYVRVMLELDTTARRTSTHIGQTAVQRIQREIEAIQTLI